MICVHIHIFLSINRIITLCKSSREIKFYDHAKDNHLNDNETYTKIDGTCDIKVMDKIKRPEAAPQRCSYKKVF